MDHNPVVKPYNHAYQTQVVDLILHIQQQEYNIPITKHDQPDLFIIEDFYQTGSGNFWVAIYDDRVVGTISLFDLGEHFAKFRKLMHKQLSIRYFSNVFDTKMEFCKMLR